jgi:hypothetical protein
MVIVIRYTYTYIMLLLTNLFPLTYLKQTNALKQIKKMETYQKATKTSAKVSKSENAANTIQYIIHFTYSLTFFVLTALYQAYAGYSVPSTSLKSANKW